MFNKLLFVVAASLSVSEGLACQFGSEEKLENLQKANIVYSRLLATADRCNNGECQKKDSSELDQELIASLAQKNLADINDIDVLHRVAVFALFSAKPQDAGTERTDLIFDFAWMQAIHRIESHQNVQRALDALSLLEQELRLDGSRALIVREARARVQKRIDARQQ